MHGKRGGIVEVGVASMRKRLHETIRRHARASSLFDGRCSAPLLLRIAGGAPSTQARWPKSQRVARNEDGEGQGGVPGGGAIFGAAIVSAGPIDGDP